MLVHRAQAPAPLGIEPALAAQLAGMRIDGASADLRADAPDGVEQVGAREQPSDVAEKERRHLEFFLRELDAGTCLVQRASMRVDAELAGFDRRVGVAPVTAGAAQQ